MNHSTKCSNNCKVVVCVIYIAILCVFNAISCAQFVDSAVTTLMSRAISINVVHRELNEIEEEYFKGKSYSKVQSGFTLISNVDHDFNFPITRLKIAGTIWFEKLFSDKENSKQFHDFLLTLNGISLPLQKESNGEPIYEFERLYFNCKDFYKVNEDLKEIATSVTIYEDYFISYFSQKERFIVIAQLPREKLLDDIKKYLSP